MRPANSTGTCGTARRRSAATAGLTSIIGITYGAIRAATWPTTPATRSTWPAGSWGSTIRSRSTRPAGGSTAAARPKRPTRRRPCGRFPNMIVNFELTLYTPYMLKIAPVIRESTDQYPYWPQCATRIEIYGSEGLMYLGRHGGGWQVFTRPKLHEAVLKDQAKGKFPDPEHKENFVAVHPQPQAAQRRRGGRPSQRPVDPLRQHQLPAGRPEARHRSQDRTDRRQPRRHEIVPTRNLSQTLDHRVGLRKQL